MKKLLLISFYSLCLACSSETQPTSSKVDTKILGNWLVLNEEGNPGVVEWGLLYVGSIKFYKDNSFKVNIGTNEDSESTPKTGTWEIKDIKSIVLYSAIQDVDTVYRDTTAFKVSFDANKLTLSNNNITIKHVKANN